MRRILLATAALVIASAGITLAPAMSASAQATCTGTSNFRDSIGGIAPIPTIGNNTGLDNCDLMLGNVSGAVKTLQRELNACYGQHLTVSGIFENATRASLQVAQRREGIPATGVYGPVTRDHLHWHDNLGACARL
jgi:peptidoglycan hydrolase-like protein with peptidoglycan-binding domain